MARISFIEKFSSTKFRENALLIVVRARTDGRTELDSYQHGRNAKAPVRDNSKVRMWKSELILIMNRLTTNRRAALHKILSKNNYSTNFTTLRSAQIVLSVYEPACRLAERSGFDSRQ